MQTLPPIGQYELRQRLGRDNVGEVWRAYDTASRRTVVIKFFRTNIPNATDSLANYVQNVERVAFLHHPNIVPIHDVQVVPSPPSNNAMSMICLAMKYIEGESLADYIHNTSAAGKIPSAAEVVSLFTALAQALDVAHRHGITHGNLKPTNILLSQSAASSAKIGAPMLTDFGATKLLPHRGGNDIPFYLAPEQIKGFPADERSDIYALGVLLYELYTGVVPFQGKRPIAVMMQHVNALPTPPHLVNPTVSPALTQVILRCLAKNPQERFPNATSLVVALANALHMPISDDLQRAAHLAGGATALDVQPKNLSPAPIPPASRTRRGNIRLLTAILAFILLLGAALGTLYLVEAAPAPSTPISGHAFFLNSGQLNNSSGQGINDELQIDLSNIPDPAPGKSYYAWLLGDVSATEGAPIALGRLTSVHGTIHYLYANNGQHANLLGLVSRFLITEDDARNPASDPLLNQSTWRYYAVLPQTASPADKLHFSMLDHLRHLLVESPELTIRGLHGGLAFWLGKNTATVSNLANSLVDSWRSRDANTLHAQIIRMLDYLDGASFVATDVPPHTPLLTDTREVQVALLGPDPQVIDPPGYVYQNEAVPGYVYLIETHINGVVLSPAIMPDQKDIAVQLIKGIDDLKSQFVQVYQDAKRLMHMSDTQLLQPSTLTMLNDIATHAQYAYTGHPDASHNALQGGALSIYANLQRLATFDVAPYTLAK
ncbi:MAG TPA: serine/threonine-protein kinase [Ktedonobacteraceae bacterium]|nr:serine/threonine-protein kinase [Ktedonobacteraceae bacterium]